MWFCLKHYLNYIVGPVAQLVERRIRRVPSGSPAAIIEMLLGAVGRRFESCLPGQYYWFNLRLLFAYGQLTVLSGLKGQPLSAVMCSVVLFETLFKLYSRSRSSVG